MKSQLKNYANRLLEKFEKKEVHSPFIGCIWGADLADTQQVSKFNKAFRYFLCVIDIYSKYAWVIPVKDKKGTTITNAFQKKLNDSNFKPNKIWVDKISEFYNRTMKSFLQNNNIEMSSTLNKGKSVATESFIRTLKNKIYKYMTIAKNVYTDKLDHIVKKYNNKYHKLLKMKPVDVKSNTYIDSSKEINEKDLNF